MSGQVCVPVLCQVPPGFSGICGGVDVCAETEYVGEETQQTLRKKYY